ILAFLPPNDRPRLRSGPSDEDLRRIRSQGYSLSAGERLAGGTAMSAPILDGHGLLRAALSVSGPRFRFGLARARSCAPVLMGAARRISGALGYRGDTIAADG